MLKNKIKRYRRRKFKQALRKKVANEKLNNSYSSLLGIENENDDVISPGVGVNINDPSEPFASRVKSNNNKVIIHKQIMTSPSPDFNNTYKHSDIAQRQYNEDLYKKSRSQKTGSLALNSLIYENGSISTDSDVCNDVISIPQSMTEYDSARLSGAGSFSETRGGISVKKSKSPKIAKSNNSKRNKNVPSTSLPYISKLLSFKSKEELNEKKNSSIVPPRFNEGSAWKPRRKSMQRTGAQNEYVPDVKPKKNMFPQSLDQSILNDNNSDTLNGLSNGNTRKCIVIYNDNDDSNGSNNDEKEDDDDELPSSSYSSSSSSSSSASSSSSKTSSPRSHSSSLSSLSPSPFVGYGNVNRKYKGRVRIESSSPSASSTSPPPPPSHH